MAYPPGISLAVIQAGKAGTFFGDAASLTATVTPVLSGTKYLVHSATGDLMVPSPMTFTAQNDSVLSFSVPHVDQPGYMDDNATPYTMWAYKVDVTVLIGNGRQVKKHTWTKNFQPLVGQDFIDIDQIASGNISEGVTAPMAEILSVNGQTGHVVVEAGGASDEDVAAFLNDPNSTTNTALDTQSASLVADTTTATGSALVSAYSIRHSTGPELRVGGVDAYELGATTGTTWQTYDGSGVVVHPSVLYFPEAFNGFRWWAAATPYPGADNQLENPSIFVSENGTNWFPPPGLTNPLWPAQTGGYNSDTHLTQGPDGKLYLMFRDYSTAEQPTEKLRVMESSDGITWTTPVTVLGHASDVRRLVSPAFWWDSATREWVMIAVDILPDPRQVLRYTAASPYGPWTLTGEVSYSPSWASGRSPWHLDAVLVGDQVVSIVHETTTDSAAGDLVLAISSDGGRTFTRAATSLVTGGSYRSSVLPVVTETGLALDVWAGVHGSNWGVNRALATIPSAAGGGDGLTEQQAEVIEYYRLSKPFYPVVLADMFDRPNDATGLGTSTSGKAWTNATGTMIVDGERARASADTNTIATIDYGVADFDAKFHLSTSHVAGHQGWFLFRRESSSNFLRVGMHGGTAYLQRITGGAGTNLLTLGSRSGGEHDYRVRCSGSTITVWLNGTVLGEVTDTQGTTLTGGGLQITHTDVFLDDIVVEALA